MLLSRCSTFFWRVFSSCLLLLRSLRWPRKMSCGPTRWDLTMCCSQLFVCFFFWGFLCFCWYFDCVVFGIHLFLRSLSCRHIVRVFCNRWQRILQRVFFSFFFGGGFVRLFVCVCVRVRLHVFVCASAFLKAVSSSRWRGDFFGRPLVSLCIDILQMRLFVSSIHFLVNHVLIPLPINQSNYLSTYLSIYLSIYVCMYLSIYLSIYLSA